MQAAAKVTQILVLHSRSDTLLPFLSLLAVAGHHSSREVQGSRKDTTTSPDLALDLATSLIPQPVCYSPRAIATLDGGGDSYDSRRGQK